MANTNSNAFQVLSISSDKKNLYIKARNDVGEFFSTYSLNKSGQKVADKIEQAVEQCPLDMAYKFKKALHEKGLLSSDRSNEQENKASFDSLLASI